MKSWFKFLNQHKIIFLTPKTWIVTAFPPKKNLVPRFESRKGLGNQIGEF